ncbi:lytic transglycosylase domain-containing protein [Burkholderia sp. Tr-20390]|uniref:lytic transglycosylase domain-containing protein n=1 Tax=Burkholderia sp. Tr-20390 TaxID=2703904 RepID=UPI00197F99F5|nr:lytic transglycosylase domain-containing protein [Burkholderia sp. Tr-20390]MBN3733176.1 lytic transglycosylase domain-containing protein [Burkholderia sp. Tr-20390]
MMDFAVLAQQCAPNVHPTTLQALVRTESGFNPFAIGVVGGHLKRQPKTLDEAVATARALDAQGLNFSMGLGQVNKANLNRYGLTYETVFDMCANLKAGSGILHDCYSRAVPAVGKSAAVGAALSCYYSGNFTRGFKADFKGTSYVQRVAANAGQAAQAPSVVPAIPVVLDGVAAKKAVVRSRAASSATGEGKSEAAAAAESEPKAQPWDAFGDFIK